MDTNNPHELLINIKGTFVKPLFYDRISGEVSYIMVGSTARCTCFDYDLSCINGKNFITKLLNKLPTQKLIKYQGII